MERKFRCFKCGHEFNMDIPNHEIKNCSRLDSFTHDIYTEGSNIDVRSMNCPKCGCFGSITALNRKIEEKIFKISEKENFILSLLYPWEYKPNKTKFANGYQYYNSYYVRNSDYKKLLSKTSKQEIDEYIKSYPSYSKKIFNKELALSKYLNDRSKLDKEFRDYLIKIAGYKIELVSDDTYLGVKYVYGGKTGKNTYGKLLMKLSDKLEEKFESTLR